MGNGVVRSRFCANNRRINAVKLQGFFNICCGTHPRESAGNFLKAGRPGIANGNNPRLSQFAKHTNIVNPPVTTTNNQNTYLISQILHLSRRLLGTFSRQDSRDCQEQDFYIQPQRLAANVFQVQPNHIFKRYLAAGLYLPQAC